MTHAVQLPAREARVSAWRGLRRGLAVRLDSAGDVLMTTPALRALRTAAPDHLALLTSPSGAAAAALLPEVDEVIVYEAPWMKHPATHGPVSAPERDRGLIEQLRRGRFDAAAIFTVHSQSALPAALACHLAAIPRRLAHARENPYALLSDWVPDPEGESPIRHEVRRQLDLLAAVGIEARDEHLSLHVPDVASRSMRAMLASVDIGSHDPWLLVHPGATAPSRRYPAAGFGEVLRRLHAATGWPILLTGDDSEVDLVEDVRRAAGGLGRSLAGQLPFAELAALVALAPILLTNNTAPAHVAAAVGTPVVDLYALTNLQHTPWQVPSRVLSVDVPCAGCRRSVCPLGHNRCLRAVEPAAVVAAVLDLAHEVGIRLPGGERRLLDMAPPFVATG